MPKHLANLSHGCTSSEHPCSQGVAEYVGTFGRRVEISAIQSTPNDR